MNSEDDASGSESGAGSKSGFGSESDGVAGLAFASSKASRSFFTNHSSEDETPAYCFMAKASKGNVFGGSEWIMDSGCTNHMTGDKELFIDDKLSHSSQKY